MKIYKDFKLYLKTLNPEIFKHANRHKIIIKYVLSGISAASVDFSLLFVLTDFFGVYYLISSTVGFACAFLISFYLQKFWTFRNNDINNIYEQLGLYLFVAISSLTANLIAVYILVENFGIWYIFAQAISGASLTVFSFLFYKYVIFVKVKKALKRNFNNNL
jgi:putative flippase GtrA